MARIAGVDLPSEKRIEVALTYIYGVGRSTAKRILATAGVSPDVRVKNLSDEDSGRLRNIIEREYKVEGSLRSEMAMNVKRLMDIVLRESDRLDAIGRAGRQDRVRQEGH